MSTTVDNRVVSMTFDNARFEQNIKTSMESLKNLNEKLKFKGSTKGLEDVAAAADKLNFSAMNNGIQNVIAHFDAMDILGGAVLVRLANAAMDTGKKLFNMFAIEPITTGFSEYELKMGSVQTIMASTGASLEEVNGYLAELNEYSDKTIYSFSDMTSNIGKFTNAGVKLEDAVLAIKGISNEAAISGANANEASRAMYNFAQALSAGAVKLIDWKSIENANMATVEFKNELINTAYELGTLRKEGDQYISTTTNLQGKVSEAFTATHMFNESLNTQWMTTDVLVKTLGRYADASTELGKKAYASAQDVKTFSMMMDTLKEAAQSGWSETWETLVGDFEQSKRLFTDLSNFFGDIIGKSAEARNSLLADIFDSPWEKLTKQIQEAGIQTDVFNDSLMNLARDRGVDIDALMADGKLLSDIVSDGTITGDMLKDTIDGLAESTYGASGATSEVTQKLINLEGIVHDVIQGAYGNGADRVKALTDAGYDYAQVQDLVNKTIQNGTADYEQMTDAQLEAVGYTEDEIKALRLLAEEANSAGSSVYDLINDMQRPGGRELIFDTIKNVLEYIRGIAGTISEAWHSIFAINPEVVYSMIEWVHAMSEGLVNKGDKIGIVAAGIKSIFNVISVGVSAVKAIVKPFGQLLGHIHGFNLGIGDSVRSFAEWTGSLAEAAKNGQFFSTVSEKISEALQFVHRELSSALNVIRPYAAALKDFLVINVVTPAMSAFMTIMEGTSDALSSAYSKFKEILSVIGSAIWSKFADIFESFGNAAEKTTASVREFGGEVKDTFGTAIDKASSGVERFKSILDNLWNSIKSVAAAIRDKLASAFSYLGDATSDLTFMDVLNTGIGAGIGAGIWKLIKMFKDNDLKTMSNSFTEFMGAAKDAVQAWQDGLKVEQIKSIAVSVAILTGAIMALSLIDADKIQNGLGAVSALLAAVTGVTVLLDKLEVKGSAKAATTLLILSGAITILSASLGNLKGIDSIDKGLAAAGTVIGIMIGLVGVLEELDDHPIKAGNVIKAAVSIAALAAGIKVMSMALLSFEPDEMKTLTIRLAILMGGLFAFFKFMDNKIMIGVASTVMALSASMVIFAGAIKLLSMLKYEEIKTGLLVIGGLMLEVSAAIWVMKKANISGVAAAILAMAVAMNLLMIPMIAIGHMDWSIIENGLGAIGGSFLALAGAIAIMGSFGGTAPQLLAMSVAVIAMAAAMNMLIVPITALGLLPIPVIATGIGALLIAFAGFGAIAALLSTFATSLLAVAGAFAIFGTGVLAIGAGLSLLAGGFATLAAVGVAGATALIGAITVLITGLTLMMPAISELLLAAIDSLGRILIESAPIIAEAVGAIISAMLEVAATLIPGVVELLLTLLDSVLEGLANHIPDILDSIEKIFIAILSAITGKSPDVLQKGVDTVKSFVGGLLDTIWYVTESVGTIIGELIAGIVSFFTDIYNKGADLVGELIDGFTNGDWDGILEAGENFVHGIWEGITGAITWIHERIKSFAGGLLDKLREGLDEHSPSKATEKMGVFFDYGFANGVTKGQKKSEKTVTRYGHAMLNAMEEAADRCRKVLDSEDGLAPTITPVLDLTNVQNGAKDIASILDNHGQFARTSAIFATSASKRVDSRSESDTRQLLKAIEKLGRKPDAELQPVHNTFYITSNDPRETAKQVSTVMQRNYERTNKSWAR